MNKFRLEKLNNDRANLYIYEEDSEEWGLVCSFHDLSRDIPRVYVELYLSHEGLTMVQESMTAAMELANGEAIIFEIEI